MWRWTRRIVFGVFALALVAALAVVTLTARTNLPGELVTPAGIRQTTSQYVKMRDGVEIAVTVSVPADLRPDEQVPVLMRTTRYWRAPQIESTLRMLIALHQVNPADETEDRQTA